MTVGTGQEPSDTVEIVLVPHTHWDREWYLPFQAFRVRLVDLIDGLLEAMERDARYVFTLDGQLATVDDYLEVRPDAEPRLRRLIAEGRLAVGPWQTLMDEFLVSGESILRNLETGRRRAEELGGVMNVGYLPDMFGHVAQMPQILRRAGLDVAVVWRGVPDAVRSHRFLWEAPDGSTLRAEYLVGGYGNAAYLLAGGSLADRLDGFAAEVDPWYGSDNLLAMYGTDHTTPAPDLLAQVDRANDQGRYRVALATLAGYLAGSGGGDGELVRLRGELRSAARANMLVGVTSSRIDLKAACARAERLLERYVEPFHALWGERWPQEFLDLAWSRVLQNSAHDSICGCSADPVSAQVLVRFAEAEQIAGELWRQAAERVTARVPGGAVAVLNPSPEPRRGLVELEFAVPPDWGEVALELPDGSRVGTQETTRTVPVLYQAELPRAKVARLSSRVHGRELFGRWVNGVSIDQAGRRITVEVGAEPDPVDLDVGPLRRRLESLSGEGRWHVEIAEAERRRLFADVPVPALGWTAVRPVEGPGAVEHAARAKGSTLSNGLLEVSAAEDGTLRIGPLEGVGRLVDGGDFGDSYNYAPPATDSLVQEPESVSVELRSAGPVRGALEVVRTYHWPASVLPDGSARSAETESVVVTTLVELRAGEPFARLRVSFENPCSDHRLRFHVPLARLAESSSAEGQFAVVERSGVPEAGHGEVPVETYPARGFVDAGGAAVLLGHVLEYELLDRRELALTLLRATGLISRSANPWREEPAGPQVAIPDCQCRRPWSVGFAVYPHEGSWAEADVLAWAERYQHCFLTASGRGEGNDLASAEGLRLDGRGVCLSSLRRREGRLELRLVNEQPEPRDAVVAGLFSERELRLSLEPWEIRTVELG
jgi:alpha-mannosidase